MKIRWTSVAAQELQSIFNYLQQSHSGPRRFDNH